MDGPGIPGGPLWICTTVAGERNPDVLATYRDVRCHSSTETIRAALGGNDRHEHVFALSQSLELYDVYQAKMLDCDRKLEVLIAALNNKSAKPVGKLSKPRIKTKQVNTPTFDVRSALYGLLGVDRILYGSDGAGGSNLAPREAWAAFRQLPLSDAEFRTIQNNIAPYMR